MVYHKYIFVCDWVHSLDKAGTGRENLHCAQPWFPVWPCCSHWEHLIQSDQPDCYQCSTSIILMSCVIVRPCRSSGCRGILCLSRCTDLFFSFLAMTVGVCIVPGCAHGPITQAVKGRSCFPAVVLSVSRPLWLSASCWHPSYARNADYGSKLWRI